MISIWVLDKCINKQNEDENKENKSVLVSSICKVRLALFILSATSLLTLDVFWFRYSMMVAMGYLTACQVSRVFIFNYGILATDFSGWVSKWWRHLFSTVWWRTEAALKAFSPTLHAEKDGRRKEIWSEEILIRPLMIKKNNHHIFIFKLYFNFGVSLFFTKTFKKKNPS